LKCQLSDVSGSTSLLILELGLFDDYKFYPLRNMPFKNRISKFMQFRLNKKYLYYQNLQNSIMFFSIKNRLASGKFPSFKALICHTLQIRKKNLPFMNNTIKVGAIKVHNLSILIFTKLDTKYNDELIPYKCSSTK
jgi:hypothetical protein